LQVSGRSRNFAVHWRTEEEMMESYLNQQNIVRSKEGQVEYHPLRPCIDADTEVLFLGSFPPQRKRWAKGFNFFYPNYINDHWRIMGLIFFGDKDYFTMPEQKTYKAAEIIEFVKAKGIGYYDTSEAVRRLKDNASDKFLEVVQKTDIRQLISVAKRLRIICTTGEKATQNLCEYFGLAEVPKVNTYATLPNIINNVREEIVLYRLPSSSRAYPMALDKKAEHYKRMFDVLKNLKQTV